jgi:hypothetical protein
LGEFGRFEAIRKRGSGLSAQDERAQSKMNFVHQSRLQQSAVDRAASLAQKSVDFPAVAQSPQSFPEIQMLLAANLDHCPGPL